MTLLVDLLALAQGLDLDEADDRAHLRDLVADRCRSCSAEDLAAVAAAFGRKLDPATPAARASVVRILGNATIQMALKGTDEVVEELPRPSTDSERQVLVASWAQVLTNHREHLSLDSFADQSIFCSRIRRSMLSMPLSTVCALALAHDVRVDIGQERSVLVEHMCQLAFGMQPTF